MQKHIVWLAQQLDEWTARNIISRDQASAIKSLYPDPKARAPWGAIVFSSIGAAVIGLGIILLFAYNWSKMPKEAKLAIVFGTLLLSHAAGLICMRTTDWRRQLGDVFCLFGSMMFGAGIWLVAQVYHIDEHYPNGFLFWGIGALAMAWALQSITQGILTSIMLTDWVCCESGSFDRAVHWGPFLVLASTGALAWVQRSRVLLCFSLAGFFASLIATTSTMDGELLLLVIPAVGIALVCLGSLARRQTSFPAAAPITTCFGWVATCVPLFFLTFHDAYWHNHYYTPHLVYQWWPFAVAMLACIGAVVPVIMGGSAQSDEWPLENWLLPVALIHLQITTFTDASVMREAGPIVFNLLFLAVAVSWEAGPIVFNLLFLAVAVSWMARGCRRGNLLPTVLGSLLFAALVIARYFDLFDSLLSRGLAFVIVGAVLVAEGILYMRTRRKLQRNEVVS